MAKAQQDRQIKRFQRKYFDFFKDVTSHLKFIILATTSFYWVHPRCSREKQALTTIILIQTFNITSLDANVTI